MTDVTEALPPRPGTAPLAEPALVPLPLGQLRPAGWLRGQLIRQRDGMAGNLDEFWPDVADSAWIGGTAEGWERGPYWLDGVVPLAYLLDDPALLAKVHHWIGYILDHQSSDGWMGPRGGDPSTLHDPAFGTHDVWPRMVLLKALLQYQSATRDQRVVPAALRLCRRIDALLDTSPLHEWGRARWADLVLCLHDLHQRSGEAWLLTMAGKVQRQGYDWRSFAANLPYPDKVTDAVLHRYQAEAGGLWMNDNFLATHGANIAMGLKAMPVWWRHTGDDKLRAAFETMLEQLDTHHGQATGLFTADEHLAGRNPSQGTETCTVVELMFSLEVALAAWGLAEPVIDRLERLAFNALPASARPDEWGHQYVQQANQVVCHVTEDRVYTNNGPAANTFGLEPHFGCCTANRHQGWPKFAARLWMRSADGGLTALSYAPCRIRTRIGGVAVEIDVDGDYPFDDTATITVRTAEPLTMPLRLRIPAWANDPHLTIDGRTVRATAGTTHTLDRSWHGEHTIHLYLGAAVSALHRPRGAATLLRGPLVFALAVDETWRRIGGQAPHDDWEVHPASPWNYALAFDPAKPDPPVALKTGPAAANPFTPDGAPVRLDVPVRHLPTWQLRHGAADEPPPSPVHTDQPAEHATFLPYGAARLRVTELPWTAP